MTYLEATINCADERLVVNLLPALESMAEGGKDKDAKLDKAESKQITLVRLVDERSIEPALYFNPHFVLPNTSTRIEKYLRFLQALRYSDQFALAAITGFSKPLAGLLYPHRDFLMLVMMRSEEEFVEPEVPDWTAQAAEIAPADVATLRTKLESLAQPVLRALSAESSR